MLLAGPPAARHNTIAELICARRTRAPLIASTRRSMQRVPYASPVGGHRGRASAQAQHADACALARRSDADGSDVVLVDVAPPDPLALYRHALRSVDRFLIVLLHPDADILIERDLARGRATGIDPSFRHRPIRPPA